MAAIETAPPLRVEMVALPEKAVEPEPDRLLTVTAADVPVKFTLPELVTAPTVLAAEILAVALAATLSEAAELKSTAFKVPPLTAMEEV